MELKIKELPVMIKTVTVDGKKMTLAMFRQIPCKIFGPDAEFIGHVRYDHDGYPRWIIYSEAGILNKCPLDLSGTDSQRETKSKIRETLDQIYIAV